MAERVSERMQALALRMWREREMRFPPRCRRMTPDTWDEMTGAWGLMVKQAEAALAAGETP